MRTWMALLVVATVLAGCSEDPAPVDDERDEFDDAFEIGEQPAIRGVVVDPGIVPMVDVLVQVNERETRTDEEGRFAFADVEPGVYLLQVAKPGYFESQVSVTVSSVDDPIVRIRMAADPAGVPYHETSSARGFLQCGVGIPGGGSYSACQTPNGAVDIACSYSGGAVCSDYLVDHRGIIEMDVTSMPTHIQAEAAWAYTTETAKVLTWEMYVRERGTIELTDVAGGTGESPVVMSLEEAAIVEQDVGASRYVVFQVFPETGGIGNVVLEQEVEIFLTTFHNMLPPEGWSLVLDGSL